MALPSGRTNRGWTQVWAWGRMTAQEGALQAGSDALQGQLRAGDLSLCFRAAPGWGVHGCALGSCLQHRSLDLCTCVRNGGHMPPAARHGCPVRQSPRSEPGFGCELSASLSLKQNLYKCLPYRLTVRVWVCMCMCVM